MRTIPLTHIVIAMALFLGFPGACPRLAAAEHELHIGRFSAGDQSGWKEETVWGAKKTNYSFIRENGKSVLMGKSVNAASGLLHKVDIDPKTHPIIRWSWKIDHTVKKGNERNKEGHDFAARLYVVFPRGLFSRTRAIEYVWGNVMTKGESLRSPYSNNAVMIAVTTGNDLAGKWVTVKRNYADDYRTAFGEDAPKVGAIAIMTDSDNTGETAVGYYGDIDILASVKSDAPHGGEPKPKEPTKESHPKQQPQPLPPPKLPEAVPAKDQKQNDTVPKEPKSVEQIRKEQPTNGTISPPGAAPETPLKP